MKKRYFNVRLSDRRLNKLRRYAAINEKTMTQIIEEFIDLLPDGVACAKNENQIGISAIVQPNGDRGIE